jgi:hypothetical protein
MGKRGKAKVPETVVNDVDLAEVEAVLQRLQGHIHLQDDGFAFESGHS